jgi:hypothetical protein
MAQFIGAQTSLQNGEYVDVRSKTSQQPLEYVTKIVPTGRCPPKEMPYMCGWSEGGFHVSSEKIRVGSGLTRQRGAPRKPSQLIGPVRFQQGNGDCESTSVGTRLRNGSHYPRRGDPKPSIELKGCSPFLQGQATWTHFSGTVERGRNKYDYATQCTSAYFESIPRGRTTACIEPFELGGITTRQGKEC